MATPSVEYQEARTALSVWFPYLSDIVWKMVYVPKPEVVTVGVDQYWRCYVNEEWFKQHDLKARVFLLRHEAKHLVMDHGLRSEPYKGQFLIDPTNGQMVSFANVAADLEVNGSRDFKGILESLPDCIHPHQFGFDTGLLMEEYAELLKQKYKDGGSGGKGKGKCSDLKDGQSDRLNEGSGAGDPQPWELEKEATDENGQPVQRVDKWEQESAKDELAQRVKQIGNMSADWTEWAEGRLNREVDWRTLLKAAYSQFRTRKAGVHAPTFMVPDRKRKSKVLYPSWVAPTVRVAVILDTSGSMGLTEINTALAEVWGIAHCTGDEVTLYEADTKIKFKRTICASSCPKIEIHGRGGTDMGVALNEVSEDKKKFDIVVIMTDGETPWPTEKFKFPVIVLLVNQYAANNKHYIDQMMTRIPKEFKSIVVKQKEASKW